MIVQCVQCDTRFQLDEARVPPGGVHVRCSRCKESFFLPHPSANQSDVVHGIAEQVVQEAESPAPEVTRDLAASSELFEAQAEAVPDEAAGGPTGESDEEAIVAEVGPVLGVISEDEDWQFNDEVPEVESVPVLEAEAEVDAAACFGSVDDFSSLIEEVAPAFEPESAVVEDTLAQPDTLAQSALAQPGMDLSGMDLSDDAPVGPEVADQDLGDPEDWNFFSDAPSSGYQPPPAVVPPTALSSAGVEADPRTNDELTDAMKGEAGRNARRPGLGRRVGSGAARVGEATGWLLTISLTVFGLFQGLLQEEVQARAPAAPFAVGALVADDLAPSWIENRHQGRILAIRGRLSNRTSRPIAQQETILITLLDDAGNPLATPPALTAIALSDESLRELPADRLHSAQARAAGALARATLGPGQSLVFTALFDEVPDAARAFALQTGPAWEDAVPAAPPSPAPLLDEGGATTGG